MIPPKYPIYFDAFAQTMIDTKGKRLGRIPGAHAYAKEWTKGFSAVWESKGGTVLTNNEIDYNTTTDFSSVASKALSEKPDVLFVGGPSQATALVIKAAREQGFKGGFVVMDQAKFEEMNKLVPMAMLEDSVGVMPTIHHPDFRAARFVEKYHLKKGADRDPPREVSLTYGAVRVLARAMELAGTVDRRARDPRQGRRSGEDAARRAQAVGAARRGCQGPHDANHGRRARRRRQVRSAVPEAERLGVSLRRLA